MEAQDSSGGFDSVDLTQIAIALAATVAVLALVVVLQVRAQRRLPRPAFAVAADALLPFAPPMAWFAIRTADGARVREVLRLEAPVQTDWNSGVSAIASEGDAAARIFVSAPVAGWTLVAGLALPHPVGPRFVDKCLPLIERLACNFADVQYFCCFPAIDHYAWARARDGKLVRAFALGDEGLIWNRGRPTRDERLLGLKLFEMKEDARKGSEAALGTLFDAGEGHVMRLAGKWGIDPTQLRLGREAMPRACVIARAPAQWKVERIAHRRRRFPTEGAQA